MLNGKQQLIIRTFLICSIVFMYLAIAAVPYLYPKRIFNTDFVSYRIGAQILLDGKAGQLYNLNTQYAYKQKIVYPHANTIFLPFSNVPVMAAFFIPFNVLPAIYSYYLIVIFNLCLIFFVIKILFPKKIPINTKLLTLAFFPIILTVFYGQISILLTCIFAGILYFLKQNKDFKAGFLSGLSLIKFQYSSIIPFALYLSSDRKSFLKGAFISIALITAINFLIFRSSPEVFFKLLFHISDSNVNTEPLFMLSLPSLIKSFFPLINSFQSSLICLFVLGLSLFYFCKIKKLSLELMYSGAVIIIVALSPHAYAQDLTLLIIPISCLLQFFYNSEKSEKTKTVAFICAMLLFIAPILFMITASYLSPILLIIIFFIILNLNSLESQRISNNAH